jgi:NADH dehydrogenase FAD-containing subunit
MQCSNPDCNRGIGLVSHQRSWFDRQRYCSKRCCEAIASQATEHRSSHQRRSKPWQYRDFGSLVSLGDYSTVGKLMGGLWVEGLVARLMYISLYKMHRTALHGIPTVLLETLANSVTRRTEPHLKLH